MDRSSECHRGAWYKTAKNCHEIRGKTLGIVGYGHVGSQLSILAEGLGMRVVFYDTSAKLNLGNAISCDSLDDVLAQSDYVSLHVPRLESTRNMFGKEQFAKMKKDAFFINCARGEVVRRAPPGRRANAGSRPPIGRLLRIRAWRRRCVESHGALARTRRWWWTRWRTR